MTVHNNTVMSIKFCKQISQKFCENNGYKREFKVLWKIWDGDFLASEANSQPCQTFKMELFARIVKNWNPFTICAKASILDIWQGSEYASELASKLKDVSFWNQFEYQR